MSLVHKILIIEPQCWGIEHVEVNTALLSTFLEAFPEAEIDFRAEQTHLSLVSTNNHLKIPTSSHLKFYSIIIPPRGHGETRRFLYEIKLTYQIFKIIKQNNFLNVLYASITGAGLWSLKAFLLFNPRVSIVAIPHIILNSIVTTPPITRPWNFFFWFRWCIGTWNPKRLNYLLLGEFIKKEVIKILPKLKNNLKTIDIPYHFDESKEQPFFGNRPVRFGSLGASRLQKRTDLFFQLANIVHTDPHNSQVEFILVGNLDNNEPVEPNTTNVRVPFPREIIGRTDFEFWALKVDYTIFCYDASAYRFASSGSFFDSLFFLKPIISLKTPFIEYYFNLLGDIGYLCDDMNEMIDIVTRISTNFPSERYKSQVENMRKGRIKFTPPVLAMRLHKIFYDETNSKIEFL